MDAINALNQLIEKFGSQAATAEKLGYSRRTRLLARGEVVSKVIEEKVIGLWKKEIR